MWEGITPVLWRALVPCPRLGLSTHLPLPELLGYYTPPVRLKAALGRLQDPVSQNSYRGAWH